MTGENCWKIVVADMDTETEYGTRMRNMVDDRK